ncbi:MAG: hypothetical protein EA364_13230 [Balneolaceae bacterium]|nr:MAG: hypothetical protein EA364_13230 [Balneolaceae bacterium]
MTLVSADRVRNKKQAEKQTELLERLIRLRNRVDRDGRARFDTWRPWIRRRQFLCSGINLAHYLALREHDLRELQLELSPLGLSSLGRLESKVMPALDSVIASLARICEFPDKTYFNHPPKRAILRGERILQKRSDAVLGTSLNPTQTRIMVTLPSEAASDPDLSVNLLLKGMDVARINCAHDHEAVWMQMVENIREASRKTGRNCRLMMDLAGPKARLLNVTLAEGKERVICGDRIVLCRKEEPFTSALFTAVCSIPEIFDTLRKGAEVWIDDGKIGTVVEAVADERAVLLVKQTGPKGAKLTADKGLNFPGTELNISPLSETDLLNLDFVTSHADIIGYSFIQTPADLDILEDALTQRVENPSGIPIVAKIETALAVHNLPDIIVRAAGRHPFAVMIARGDLAVEIGFERLAEIQEEILWLTEAAHVPVIWATQVLERLVKKGIRSRAEITDAAMSVRAECVMLNKGPYILEAIDIINDLHNRMHQHQAKKTPRLRALKSWTI